MTEPSNMLPRPYESHEEAYRRLLSKGGESWNDLQKKVPPPGIGGIDCDDQRFLEDALAQPWSPRGGLVVEMGCGTAPMLRWFCKKGFRGLGLDVSATAVNMGRSQSAGCDLALRHVDVCQPRLDIGETADIVLDGRCLHCLTDPKDRHRMLKNARRLLRPRGMFIVQSMCGPVNRKRFGELYAPQRLVGKVVYVPSAAEYAQCRTFDGKRYLPTRYLAHWRDIMREVRQAGFRPQLTRLATAYGDEVNGGIYLAAIVEQ